MLGQGRVTDRDNPSAVGTDDYVNIPNRVERPLIQPEAVYNNGISLVILEY